LITFSLLIVIAFTGEDIQVRKQVKYRHRSSLYITWTPFPDHKDACLYADRVCGQLGAIPVSFIPRVFQSSMGCVSFWPHSPQQNLHYSLFHRSGHQPMCSPLEIKVKELILLLTAW
jgi:hypothetical protein